MPDEDKGLEEKIAEEYYKSLFKGELFKYETKENCLKFAKIITKHIKKEGYHKLRSKNKK